MGTEEWRASGFMISPNHFGGFLEIVAMFALSLAGFALLGWLSTQAWFYQALGVRPSLGAPDDAIALLLQIHGRPTKKSTEFGLR